VAADTETRTTAVSLDGSEPTSVAFAIVPSSKRTVIFVAPLTTWEAVTMSPCRSYTKPVPSAWVCCEPPGTKGDRPPRDWDEDPSVTLMSTTPGLSFA